jgi:hypothetical protein
VPIVTVRAFEEAADGGQVPPRALTRLAMAHLAIYDAVNAIEGARFEGSCQHPASACGLKLPFITQPRVWAGLS